MLETIFILLVAFLLILACVDLFVGVSNDAVNFLNSAVGSRIAPLKIILIVASIGVLFGATFSSGMMEVARSGVFHPELFSFYDVILIFFAVMVTDVILINVFNIFGLPTSTTVSIIFELLGAAVCASAYKLYSDGQSFSEIFNYIKSDRTATIVSGILISVAVAFISGAIIQFILRVLFSFRFQNSYRYLGGLFTGFSLTAIIYFLVMKGAKGASFMKPEYIDFINANTTVILWTLFIGLTVLGQLLVMIGFNVFKIIILGGTFALAFSFAGNDLVNFIGVPLAALDAFTAWTGSGNDPHLMTMEILNNNEHANSLYLVLAGLIMVTTLWISKKARRVIQTSINLSSSTQGEREQFGATPVGRVITRIGLDVSRATYNIIPQRIKAAIASRYIKAPVVKGEIPLPFDYVRASVNLVLSAILIASATSLKLPLSTTYVTFMVAMGTSFADGAWDRESAVYRISGVVTVIAGWFLTAFSAFTLTFIVCLIFFIFSYPALIILMIITMIIIYRTNFAKTKVTETMQQVIDAKGDNEKVLQAISSAVQVFYKDNLTCLERAFNEFFADNEFKLRKVTHKAFNIMDELEKERSEYYSMALDKEQKVNIDANHYFYLSFTNMYEVSKSVHNALSQAVIHVANRHTIFSGQLKENLEELLQKLQKFALYIDAMSKEPSSDNMDSIAKRAKKLNRSIDKSQLDLVNLIGTEKISMRSSEIYLTFLGTVRTMVNRYLAVALLARALAELTEGKKPEEAATQAQMLVQVNPTAEAISEKVEQ